MNDVLCSIWLSRLFDSTLRLSKGKIPTKTRKIHERVLSKECAKKFPAVQKLFHCPMFFSARKSCPENGSCLRNKWRQLILIYDRATERISNKEAENLEVEPASSKPWTQGTWGNALTKVSFPLYLECPSESQGYPTCIGNGSDKRMDRYRPKGVKAEGIPNVTKLLLAINKCVW